MGLVGITRLDTRQLTRDSREIHLSPRAVEWITIESSFLLVEGVLQNQDGVTSIKAGRVSTLDGLSAQAAFDSTRLPLIASN